MTRISFCMLAALALLVPGASTWGQQNSAIDYVPSSAFIAIDAMPKAALAEPAMELVPHELIKVFGEKELGINLLELEQVTILVEAMDDPEMRDPPGVGAVVRFATPQTLGGNMARELEPTNFGGLKGYSIDDEIAIVLVDDKTFLIGLTDYVGKMLNAKGASSPLIDMLRKPQSSDHMRIHVAIEPVRDLIKSNLPPAEQVPPPFRRFLKIPDLVSSISYRGSFSEGGKEQLIVDAIDDASAAEVVDLIGQGIEMAKTAALSWVAMESGIDDQAYQDAIVAYGERVAEFVKKAVAPEVSGTEIVFTVEGQQAGGLTGIGTIGVLTGMLLPAVQQVREAARRTQSINQLRQIALACHNYESAYRKFPLPANLDAEGKPLLSWRVHILPFIEENNLYDQFHMDEPWDSPHNIQLVDQMPMAYVNQNAPELTNKTVFLGVSGEGTIFNGKKIGFANITDGSSNTAMFVEADVSEAVIWTKPGDWVFDKDDPMRGLGGLRPAGFNVAMADGSVQLLSAFIDPDVWAALCTMAGGEVVPYDAIR